MNAPDIVALSGREKSKLIQFALERCKAKIEKLTFPRLWSEKLDGVFCMALQYQGNIFIYSRTGEVYTSMKHIEKEIFEFLNDGCDGERDMIIFEADAEGVPQSTVSGWCRDTQNQHEELIANCHTMLNLKDFVTKNNAPIINKNSLLPFKAGWEVLKTLKNYDFKYLKPIEQIEVSSWDEAIALSEKVWEKGGEGGVLRNPDGVYKGGKRVDDIIKIKKVLSFDLEVIDTYIGKKGTKYENTLGGIVCRWKDGKKIKVAGMTDEERNSWWADKSLIIGKIVEVHAMTYSSTGLLREPRYKGIRTDKEVGDF